jgi:hypothetical protein
MRFWGLFILWLSIYTLFAYPEGLPWDQWLIATLMAFVGILLLSVEKVKGEADE